MRCCLVAFVVWAGYSMVSAAELGTLKVDAGEHPRIRTLASIDLPAGLELPALLFVETEQGRFSAQVDSESKPAKLWFFTGEIDAGDSAEYTIIGFPGTSTNGKVALADDGKKLDVHIGDAPVLSYQHAVMPVPESANPIFKRSGFIHPVQTPSGLVITDPMPVPHHTHQHAVMMAWVNTTYQGHKVDFWNSAARQGKVEHKKVVSETSGPIFADLITELRHIDTTDSENPKDVLNETWHVRVYNFTDRYVFDITSTQLAATNEPLTVNEYHYGGMAFRGSDQWWKPKDCQMLTSEGFKRRKGNHSRPEWVTMSGKVNGAPAGILVMGHPTNFRYPQHVRLHPNMPYLCFAPMVEGAFTIDNQTPYVSRYRFVAYDGDISKPTADRYLHDYIAPPKVTLTPAKQ